MSIRMSIARKRLNIVLLAVFLTAAGLPSILTAAEKNISLDAKPGDTLEVKLRSGGKIHIRGWDKNKAKVNVSVNAKDTGNWIINVDKTSKGIRVETVYKGPRSWSGNSSDVDIRIPRVYNLKLKTMGGDITLDNIEGVITGKTMGGPLFLTNLKKKIDLKTMGGPITLKDSDIDGKVKTMGGRVLVENVVGDITGKSMGGNVIYKNVKQRTAASGGKVVRIKTMGGGIDVNKARYGAEVVTMGGNIHINWVKEFVKAKTMGGNIIIGDIDGYVSAKTMGGNIHVTMTGDPEKKKRHVHLTSLGGDITLFVPKNLSMDVDLKIAFTKDSAENYRFITDFKIDETQTDRWNFDQGKSKKYIYGKANIKGGKHKIRIYTVNGNITLKRK